MMPDLDDDLRVYFDALAAHAEGAVGSPVRTPALPGDGPRRHGSGRRGWLRPALVAAVLVAAVVVAVVAIWGSRGGSHSVSVVAPPTSAPTAGTVSRAQWRLSVDPDGGLQDGQTVHVHAAGLNPGQMAAVVTCDARNLLPGVGMAGCDAQTLVQLPADDHGSIDMTYELRRLIRVGTTPYDCGSEPRGCDLAVGPAIQPVGNPEGIGIEIHFAPGPTRPLPTVTLAPSTGLRDGQTIEVTGRNFAANASVFISECPTDADCGSAIFGVSARTDATGTVTQPLVLHRAFTVPANLPGGASTQTLDCSMGCTVTVVTEASSDAAYASTPLTLQPG